MQEKNVIIVGGGSGELASIRLAEIQAQHPECVVVTMQEAKEQGLMPTFEIKAPPPLPEMPELICVNNGVGWGYESERAKRRKDNRKKKLKNKKL